MLVSGRVRGGDRNGLLRFFIQSKWRGEANKEGQKCGKDPFSNIIHVWNQTEDGMLDNLSPSMATVCKPLQHVYKSIFT